jgi:tetratricopeptide (TPR) repeat protein
MIGAMAGSATPQTGWDALRAAQWAAARAAFEADLAGNETAAAFDGLARARWWLSDIPGAIEAWERAYTAYRRGGLDEPAAHVAVLLSREHAEGLGNDALANGWLARARDLLDGYPDSVEWGWVALVESEQAVDPTPALEHAEQALAVARRTRDPDLELAGLGRAGLAEIALGRIEAGVTRFDEGMAASAAGEAADLRTLGDLYCAANLAAEITLDMGRFEQWTGAVMGFMERTGHPDLLTFCGTCCAGVCRAAGQWEDGEGWLTRTLSQLERSGQKARCVHPATGWPRSGSPKAGWRRPSSCCAATRTSPRPSRPWSPCTLLAARPPWRRPVCIAA